MLRKCPVLLCMRKLVSGSAFRSSTPQQPCKIAFTLVLEMFRWPYCSGKDMKDGPYTRDRRDFDNSTQKKAQGHPTVKNCMTKDGSLALSSALVPISFIVRLFSISLIPLLNEWSPLCCSASVPYPLSTQITANFPGSHGASRSVLRSVWLLEWWHGTATKPPSKPSTQFPVSRTFPLRLAHKMFRGYRKDESVLRSLQFASLFFFSTLSSLFMVQEPLLVTIPGYLSNTSSGASTPGRGKEWRMMCTISCKFPGYTTLVLGVGIFR